MDINKKSHNDNILIGLSGEVDLHSSGKLRDALLDIIGQGNSVLVDFSELDYIDSSGVAALVESYNEAKKKSVGFTIVGAQGGPLQVLELTRLVAVFPMAQSLDDI
jgi:anti-sigma B factor antagonist